MNAFLNRRGFTMLETLVALAVGMLIIGGIYTIFIAQNNAAVRNDQSLEMNSGINASFNMITRDLRMAGYKIPPGMGVSPFNNYGTGTVANDFQGTALKAGLTTDPTRAIKTGTDGALVLYPDNACTLTNGVGATGFSATTAGTAHVCEGNCFRDGNYAVGDVLIVYGPYAMAGDETLQLSNTGFFVKVSSISTNQTGDAGCAGATHTNVGFTVLDKLNFWACPGRVTGANPCPGAAPSPQWVARLQSRYLYYINVSNQFSRLPLDSTFAPEVIAYGAEDLQLQYDVANPPPSTSCTVAQWSSTICNATCSSCNSLGQWLSGTPPSQYLAEIRGVRVGLMLRTPREDKKTYLNKGRAMSFFDHTVTSPPADSYRRRPLTQMVRVKNLEMRDF